MNELDRGSKEDSKEWEGMIEYLRKRKKTYEAVAMLLGLKGPTLSRYRKELKTKEVPANVFEKTKVLFEKEKRMEDDPAKYKKSVLGNPIPFFTSLTDAIANKPIDNFLVLSADYPDGSFAYGTYLDEMYPRIKPGTTLILQLVKHWQYLPEGKNRDYLVLTKDSIEYLRHIEVTPEKTHLVLTAEKDTVTPHTLPFSEIKAVFLVNGTITRH
ncbi:hypothetical protein [Deminuibacter soli]|uniref:Uncharacterized protein n=1 Tax=Deminuibacter soli TaxID=2291815 RepID=A0A3E1NDQ8_9BACT|nr:hypothetical protein [Deminuibacter soli]RFM26002.1 hypothetical protein DXN05_21975 [Deminuibacter soli]